MSGLLDDEELQRIYQWVDEVPLSRPKRNIARDFADGVLVAEIVSHYFPRLVELHNYSAANSYAQKIYNWNTLNTKVFRKLGFTVQKQELDELCNCHAQAAEKLLKQLQIKMAKYGARKAAAGDDAAAPTGGGASPMWPRRLGVYRRSQPVCEKEKANVGAGSKLAGAGLLRGRALLLWRAADARAVEPRVGVVLPAAGRRRLRLRLHRRGGGRGARPPQSS